MRISVGSINARCEDCGGEDFQPIAGETPPGQELACFACGLRTTRHALLTQVADETVRRAEAFLEASRKLRSQASR